MASCTRADDEVQQNRLDRNMGNNSVSHCNDTPKELMDARLLIEAMESEQVHLITELQHLQEENQRLMAMLSKKDKVDRESILESQSPLWKLGYLGTQTIGLLVEGNEDVEQKALQAKLEKMRKDLEEVRLLNNQYQEDQVFRLNQQHQIEEVRDQVEMETSRTILHLQEDVASLQLELHERLCYMTQENTGLRDEIAAKEQEIKALCMEWERATLELTSFLVDGSKNLKDVSGQVEAIARSFPQSSCWISEHVERAATVCMEKDESILTLEKSLEDAQNSVVEMELKLSSLKEAAMVLNELQQLDIDESNEEAIHLSKLSNGETKMVKMEDSKCITKNDQVTEAEVSANAAFLAANCLPNGGKIAQRNDVEIDTPFLKLANLNGVGSCNTFETNADTNVLALEYLQAQVKLARLGVLESENAIKEFYTEIEMHISTLQSDVCNISSSYGQLVQDLVNEIREMRTKYMKLEENHMDSQSCTVESLPVQLQKLLRFRNQNHMLSQIRDELAKTNEKLNIIKDCFKTEANMLECLSENEDSIETATWTADCSLSGSDVSTQSVTSGIELDGISYTPYPKFPAGLNMIDLKLGGSVVQSDDQQSKKSKNILKGPESWSETTRLCLRKELAMAFNAFHSLYVQLTTLLSVSDVGNVSYSEGMRFLELLVLINF